MLLLTAELTGGWYVNWFNEYTFLSSVITNIGVTDEQVYCSNGDDWGGITQHFVSDVLIFGLMSGL